MNKQFYKSKTFWFNALTVIVAVAVHFGYQPNDVLGHNVESILTNPFLIGLANLVLRKLTTSGISLTAPTDAATIDSLP